jgi:hypothetical protein
MTSSEVGILGGVGVERAREYTCRCCGRRSVGAATREAPGYVMRCLACGTEYACLDDPGDDVQAAIDRSHRDRRLADSLR